MPMTHNRKETTMFSKIRNWLNNRKATTLSNTRWMGCNYDCYDEGGCYNCAEWVERYDAFYGDIGCWLHPGDTIEKMLPGTYASFEEMWDEAIEYDDYRDYLMAHEERWDVDELLAEARAMVREAHDEPFRLMNATDGTGLSDEDDTMDCGCSSGSCYCEPDDTIPEYRPEDDPMGDPDDQFSLNVDLIPLQCGLCGEPNSLCRCDPQFDARQYTLFPNTPAWA